MGSRGNFEQNKGGQLRRIGTLYNIWAVDADDPKQAYVTWGAHWRDVGATWRMLLNHPCAAAMRFFVKLL